MKTLISINTGWLTPTPPPLSRYTSLQSLIFKRQSSNLLQLILREFDTIFNFFCHFLLNLFRKKVENFDVFELSKTEHIIWYYYKLSDVKLKVVEQKFRRQRNSCPIFNLFNFLSFSVKSFSYINGEVIIDVRQNWKYSMMLL